MSKKRPPNSRVVLGAVEQMVRQMNADMILVAADSGLSRSAVQSLDRVCPTLVVTRNSQFLRGIEELGIQRLRFDFDVGDMAHFERVRQGVILAMEGGYIQRGDVLVCLTNLIDQRGIDTLMLVDTSRGFEGFDPQQVAALAGDIPIEVVKAALDLALVIGMEGREGEPVGTLLVIGDSERVLTNSRPMTFDPFRGYSEREKNICNPEIREGVKEVALMDGAFIIQDDGVILSAGRYISADAKGVTVPKGLGARHVAAAAITNHTKAIAVAVSESTGTVRGFKRGEQVIRRDPPRGRKRPDRRR
jgi:DNA integrity scanning protein DisA with diadenylate cyclase activity